MNVRSYLPEGKMVAQADYSPRGEQTRQAILDAAHALFLENGFNGTSMRQIAAHAGGIAVGGIYNHFSSKSDIFRALMKERGPYGEIAEVLQGISGETGPEIVANVIRELIPVAVEHIHSLQLILIDLQEFHGQTSSEIMAPIMPHILAFIERVVATGGMREDLPSPVAWRTVVHLIIGYALTEMLLYDEQHRVRFQIADIQDIRQEEWLEGMIEIYLHGAGGGLSS
jgi:AcrR family transcriptional regulator